MPLNKTEMELLRQASQNSSIAADRASEAQSEIAGVSKAIRGLSERLSIVESKQEDCPARRDHDSQTSPGNRSERAVAWGTILIGLIAIISLIVSLLS